MLTINTIKFIFYRLDNREQALATMIKNVDAEIVVGRIHPHEDAHKLTDFTIQYIQDDLVWIVSSTDFVPMALAMFLIFDKGIWIGCILSYIVLCFVVWRIAKKFETEFQANHKLSFVAWNALGMLMGQPATLKLHTIKIRILYFIWSWFCLLWTSAYTSILISVITTPQHYRMVSIFKVNK